jgi:hypothetical protein
MKKNKPIPAFIKLHPGFNVIKFPWGAAVKNMKTGKYIGIYLPGDQELNLEDWDVELHDNGIEFLAYHGKR